MEIKKNVNLHDFNTFMLPSVAKYFCEVETIDDIFDLIKIDEFNWKKYFLWQWANTIFTWDFDWLIVKINIKWKEIIKNDDDLIIKVWAWENRTDFVIRCAENNYVWMENLAYIPSSVWASAVQNIWAYWAEAKDVIYEVEWINLKTWEIQNFKNSECNFAYRDSIFKYLLKDNFIITYVTYKLQNFSDNYEFNCEYAWINEKISELWFEKEKIKPLDFVQVITEIRKWKLPDWKKIWTAGSFFKNPIITKNQWDSLQKVYPELKWFDAPNGIKLSAWQLIDMCWFKWQSNWKVWTYSKHALILVNEWGAIWTDIIDFSTQIQNWVEQKFWVLLEPEAIFVK